MYTITICAVIFGADETLLGVNLGNDFEIKRTSLKPQKDNLHSIFVTDGVGLRRDYEAARIDESLDVLCIFKSYTVNLKRVEADEYYQKTCDQTLEYLDDKIRLIRLFVEGPVRFKKLSIKMESDALYLGKTEMCDSFTSIIPIGEAMGTNIISKFHCDSQNIKELNDNIILYRLPLSHIWLNNAQRYYDLSYHQDNFISITLLITCLEILFINKENAKKEKLAKRCSVFLYEGEIERLECYNELRKAYKYRSDFVHDGVSPHIKDKDILFLRDCVRKSLIQYMNKSYIKSEVLKKLKETIKKLDYWSYRSE